MKLGRLNHVGVATPSIEASIAIQNEGFENLIKGSNLTMEQVLAKTPSNWYLDAQEALDLGLVHAII